MFNSEVQFVNQWNPEFIWVPYYCECVEIQAGGKNSLSNNTYQMTAAASDCPAPAAAYPSTHGSASSCKADTELRILPSTSSLNRCSQPEERMMLRKTLPQILASLFVQQFEHKSMLLYCVMALGYFMGNRVGLAFTADPLGPQRTMAAFYATAIFSLLTVKIVAWKLRKQICHYLIG